MTKFSTLALPVLAAVALLGVIVLAALGVDVPGVLEQALYVLLGGAAGATVPRGPSTPAGP